MGRRGVSRTRDGGLIKKRSARSVGGLTARKARKDNRRAAGLETRRRRGWIGRGRGARRGALAERARVWFGGGGRADRVGCRVFRGTPRGSRGCLYKSLNIPSSTRGKVALTRAT